MRERAERLGGNIFFETEPDEGFEIHLSIPLDIER
jgi:signal transduction histidine kinase